MPGMIRLIVAFIIAAFTVATAAAQTYPNRPIRLFVGYPPGGATDIIARVVGQGLSDRLGQPVVVENRPGSGANIAADIVAKSAPDGYTLIHGPDNLFVVNPHVYSKLNFDPLKDFVAIGSLISNQVVLAVNPKVPANSLQEFVALARKTSPPLFYASIGNGSLHHLAMELLKERAGIDLTHVPYRGGGPAGVALLAGDVSAGFGGGSLVPTILSGKLRGLAVSGAKRSALLPDLPTIGEIYPGYEVAIWHGLFAPAGTPQPIVERLRTALNAVLANKELMSKITASGSGEPYITTPEQFRERMLKDYAMYGKLIKRIGLKIN
jgi:tripartite-type tricarboxylate transporter receptor subunit TctC